MANLLRLGNKNKSAICFVFLSTFRNFVRIRRISLYKGSLEDWGKTGLRIGDRTQFHVLLQIAQCARLCRLPFMGQNYSIYSNLAYIFPKKTQQRCGVLRDCDASNQWGQVVWCEFRNSIKTCPRDCDYLSQILLPPPSWLTSSLSPLSRPVELMLLVWLACSRCVLCCSSTTHMAGFI